MLALRITRATARIVPRATGRRAASTTEHGAHDSHHHSPQEEAFGKGFYITIASVVGVLAVYKFTAGVDGDSPLTRLINKYSDDQELWLGRNDRRTVMLEQAGRDRALFQHTKKSGLVPVKFIETLNSGSPYNNEAGRAGGHIDLEALRKQLKANQ